MQLLDRAHCVELDRDDPLAFARDRFHLPEGVLYLDGNSLGALPKATPARVAEVVRNEWGNDLITGWNKHGWVDLPKNLGAQWPPLRRLYGRKRLNSITYQRIMRWNSRVGLTRALARLRGRHPESVIQDVDVPVEHAAGFLAFLHREVGILPIWLCPIRVPRAAPRATLYPIAPGRIYVNFGFWDVVEGREPRAPGRVNRAIEREVARLSGVKSLYSESYYDEDEFWRLFDRDAYRALKARYDPGGRLPGLYEKCVLRRSRAR